MLSLIRFLSVQCTAISIHPSSDSIVITGTFHFSLSLSLLPWRLSDLCAVPAHVAYRLRNGTTGVNKHYFTLYADYMFSFSTLVLLQGAFPL